MMNHPCLHSSSGRKGNSSHDTLVHEEDETHSNHPLSYLLDYCLRRRGIQTQLASRMGADGAGGEERRLAFALSLPGGRRAWHRCAVVSEKISRDQRRYDLWAG